MSPSRSGPGGSGPRSRIVAPLAGVALAAIVLAGCGSAGRTGARPAPTGAAQDWLNRTYTVTCDGLVPGGFPADVVDGVARVVSDGSRAPYIEHYDVTVTGTAQGDVDGDGAPDEVVLLNCAPQPSNYFVQEVQAFSATGRSLGTFPSPRTLQGDAPLPPVYDPAGLSVQHGEVVSAMTAYGPDDSHAGGPSLPLTVRWRFDGQGFVRVTS
jgi:hypothetical protein